MTDAALTSSPPARTRTAAQARLKKRHRDEAVFRFLGLAAIGVAILFLAILLTRIVGQGYTAFWTHQITTEVYLDPARIERDDILGANYDLLVADQLVAKLGLPDPTGEIGVEMKGLLSPELGFQMLERVRDDPDLIGRRITVAAPVGGEADVFYKGQVDRGSDEADRLLGDAQIDLLDRLKAAGLVEVGFNETLFTRSDSTQPEIAGLLGAVVGSAMMLAVTALIAIPVGVLAAVYLEEFAPKNRFTDLIEVNINNLAAVPSIVYGLLGLAVFINAIGLPRSSPLVGGLVLALMALPTVIIATRSSLKAVPPSIREAALGVGASKSQAVFQHVLPLAMPGVMTGVIIAMAHALGETAPLLMIGMVSFVPGVPAGLTDAASTLPTQIYIWENASERAFHERTAAAIMVLLAFMIVMNSVAIVLRRRFERRW
jgi:phosphate transport system permease protein